MKLRTVLRTLALAAALGGLLACALTGPEPVVTPEELEQAEREESLESLYERVATELAALEPGSDAAARTREALDEVGRRLGARVARETRDRLEAARMESGLVPREALELERERIAPVERWDPDRFAELRAELDTELERTEEAIRARRERLARLGDDQALERLEVLEALGELSGAGSEAQSGYAEERLAILDEMRRRADEALRKEDLDEAQRVLKILQKAEPEAAVEDQLVEVDAKVFERDFWSALERGDADAAYEAFSTLAESTSFEAVRPRLEGSADKMARYFAAVAAEATEQGRLGDAYRWFVQAREIRAALGRPASGGVAEEKAFLGRMRAAYEKARAEERPGLAWGVLAVIDELSAETPKLRRQIRETREEVVARATRRLTALPFDEAEDARADFGEAVASKVIQHLFEDIPEDVRIIEREQLADVLREKEIEGDGEVRLASANYLVQGDILEAKVDSVEQKGRKTQRVVTEVREVRNPKHEWWMGLDKDERKDTPEPQEFVEKEIREDISFDVTVHRKVGIFNVAYRLIDAQTAKVIFADSVREKVVHEDESREGIELGDFEMEFKLADLPSDIEILTELADTVSRSIGTRIAEVLESPENDYRDSAERYASEGNYAAASEQAAYAVVLSERKGKPVDGLRSDLRRYAVAASTAL